MRAVTAWAGWSSAAVLRGIAAGPGPPPAGSQGLEKLLSQEVRQLGES